ncbi:TadE/TadG family type IV pilus assembly protein [Streptomyces sp. BE147]|uniref:TadE/TadG family type IV pilus assembly protein n=1 Tax=Streptomyces sp. BE147 TaxID=3002524 RepID=UPI002E769749|nr:TadE/TadG family type IV pilus assembly protein [Streptomyces sp. BE147]MEE1741796.1 TadE/TadG family type IV pilus assembly protein [Streptomyces sp. BE147]
MTVTARVKRSGGKSADGRRPASRRGDRGQVAIEYLGFLPLLILVALLAIQAGLAAYTAAQAGTAARAAARTATQDFPSGNPRTAARDSMSKWIANDGFRYRQRGGTDDVTVTIEIKVPNVVPGMDGKWGKAKRSSTMPRG